MVIMEGGLTEGRLKRAGSDAIINLYLKIAQKDGTQGIEVMILVIVIVDGNN